MNRSDNFNRADNASSLGTPSDGGSAWTPLSGTWGISTNEAYCSVNNDGQNTAVLDSTTSAVAAQATANGMEAATDAGLIVRAADASDYILGVFRGSNNSATALQLYTRVAGTFTSLGSWSGTIASGDVIKLSADSSNNLTLSQNGTARVTASSSAGSTNTKSGLRWNAGTLLRFDDFSITDLSAGGGILYTQLERDVRGMHRGIWEGSL